MIGYNFIFETDLLTKRGHNSLMRELNREVMERHGKRNLRRHFQDRPETRPGGGYRYKRRGKEYTDKKFEKFKHKIPNVRTGSLRDAVLSKWKVTATASRGTLRSAGTREHALWGYQRAEIEAVSNKEFKEHIRWQQAQYKKRAATSRYKRKTRKKIG